MSFLFHNFFYAPLYNGLIAFINIIPYHDVGLAVIIFTCLIKIIIFPLSIQSIKTQFEMKQIEPELNEIKIKYKDDKQIQAEKTMQLYKDKGINPFAGILLMLIQLPILIALYWVFYKGGLPNIDQASIYSFTKIPDTINMMFLGLDVTKTSILFAVFVAVAQFLQMQITLPKQKKVEVKAGQNPAFSDELAKSMNMQMKYVMPVIMFFIAKSFPLVVSLYLITSSLFAIGQELYIRSKYKTNLGQVAKK
ncbi:MAG: YidC/Oxa1 family membrane protein insertase [Candidatus Paceibacterota bacterium]|jgi:YidC/Oxa1 family membrane protein insertase